MSRISEQALAKSRTQMGLSGTPTYNSWSCMMSRCYRPKDKRYAKYGGRGIKVCDSWHSFEAFLHDMGERPLGMTLGRKDNDKDYTKDNCKWETQEEQNNNRSNCVLYTLEGKTQTLAQWAKEKGLNYSLVYYRLRNGWTVEKALNTKPSYGRIRYILPSEKFNTSRGAGTIPAS